MRLLKQITLMLLIVALTGCGFHLRGELPISNHLKQMYLETSSDFTPLSQAIEQTLSENNIRLMQTPENAQFILKVFNEKHRRTQTIKRKLQ